ncbi:general odorant-binding protein 28a-like [Eurosta solidaginis]|uniref:general odorant-binding protein 28a-like n=1 Tax=Eurosta solidaginis TaxID=178769 RepID=UPI0035310A6E
MAKLIFVATICILSATVSQAFNKEEAVKELMKKAENCKGEVGASDTDVEEMVKQEAASSVQGKCLRACLMKHFGLMDDSGKFLRSAAVKHAEDYFNNDADKLKVANEILDACVNIAVPADHCEAAEAYGKCFVEQVKAHGIEKFDFETL